MRHPRAVQRPAAAAGPAVRRRVPDSSWPARPCMGPPAGALGGLHGAACVGPPAGAPGGLHGAACVGPPAGAPEGLLGAACVGPPAGAPPRAPPAHPHACSSMQNPQFGIGRRDAPRPKPQRHAHAPRGSPCRLGAPGQRPRCAGLRTLRPGRSPGPPPARRRAQRRRRRRRPPLHWHLSAPPACCRAPPAPRRSWHPGSAPPAAARRGGGACHTACAALLARAAKLAPVGVAAADPSTALPSCRVRADCCRQRLDAQALGRGRIICARLHTPPAAGPAALLRAPMRRCARDILRLSAHSRHWRLEVEEKSGFAGLAVLRLLRQFWLWLPRGRHARVPRRCRCCELGHQALRWLKPHYGRHV